MLRLPVCLALLSAAAVGQEIDVSGPVQVTPQPQKAPTEPLGIDLSEPSRVRSVLVVPPIVRLPNSAGAFTGLSPTRALERFEPAAHQRLVASFQKELEGKVLPVEDAAAAVAAQQLGPTGLRTAAGIARLAKATHVEWVVVSEVNKTGSLMARVYDAAGAPQGEPVYVSNGAAMSQKNCDDLAAFTAKRLDVLVKTRPVAVVVPPAPEPTPEDEELERELRRPAVATETWKPDRQRVRALALLGMGGAVRGLEVSGDAAAALAELRNGAVVGLGVYAQLAPLQWFDRTAGQRWSDAELDVNFHRALVHAQGVAGSIDGQGCAMTDDDLQLRATWRFRVGEGMLPLIGLAGGYSQERTVFACDFPLISATYRGADLQLRVNQPLFRDLVSLDVALGPRFLMPGPLGNQPGFSMAGEAWVEVKPWSVVYARGGARVSRLSLSSDQGLAVTDTRAFFALEAGAFF